MQLKNEVDRAAGRFTEAMQRRVWSPHTLRAYDAA
jgi:hypothetical protein